MMRKIKIGYFADGKWSHNLFKWLIKNKSIEVSFICLRNKNPDIYLINIAKENKVKILKPKNINLFNFINKNISKDTNLFVSMSYNQIFKKKILSIPNLGSINCHAGKLPFYRGRNPLNWALINGEKEFGITTHYINNEIDRGDIIIQKIYKIKLKDTYDTLLKKAIIQCPKILIKSIKIIQSGKINKTKQNSINKKGSYYKKRKPGDEIINWNSKAINIFNFVRALSLPGPMACSSFNRKKIYINKVDYFFKKNYKFVKPGTIIKVRPRYFYISAQDLLIKVLDWKCDFKLHEHQVLT